MRLQLASTVCSTRDLMTMVMTFIRALASVKFKMFLAFVLLIIVTVRERKISSFHPSQQEGKQILIRNDIMTAPPTRKQRTSTEYTILGKRLHSQFSMSSYKPGQNSPPLQHAVKTVLNIINNEMSDPSKEAVKKTNFSGPDFHPAKAQKINFVRFV